MRHRGRLLFFKAAFAVGLALAIGTITAAIRPLVVFLVVLLSAGWGFKHAPDLMRHRGRLLFKAAFAVGLALAAGTIAEVIWPLIVPLVALLGAGWCLGPLKRRWTIEGPAQISIGDQAQSHGAGFRRKPIPEAVRHEVWRRDGGRCVDCGSREQLEFDHIVPVSKGGSNTARNIELRCATCNRKKGAKI